MEIDGMDLTVSVAYMPRYNQHLPWAVLVGNEWSGVQETNFPTKDEAYQFAINTLKRGLEQ